MKFEWHTSAKFCLTFFPSASYMIGFASRFALHTLHRMVVLPAFALPMTRMRNWGHSWQISAGPKAPSLNGRASLDEWTSWFSVDMAGEEESVKTMWWSEINQWRYRFKDRVSFLTRNTLNQNTDAYWRCFLKSCPAMYSQEKPDSLLVGTHFITTSVVHHPPSNDLPSISKLPLRAPIWTSCMTWIHDGHKAWLNILDDSWRSLVTVSFLFLMFLVSMCTLFTFWSLHFFLVKQQLSFLFLAWVLGRFHYLLYSTCVDSFFISTNHSL